MWLSAPRPGHVGQALSQLWAGGGQAVLLVLSGQAHAGVERAGQACGGRRGPGDSHGGGGQLRASVLSQGLGGDGGALWTGEV